MSGELHASKALDFDYAVADALVRTFRAAAAKLDGQVPSRASYVSTANTEFKGHFAELFATNAATAASDAGEVAARLRTVADFAQKIRDAAKNEDDRRRRARDWELQHDDWWEKGWDWVTSAEMTPPSEPAEPAPVFAASAPPAQPRETPDSGGGAGGTSSARPEELRSFAAGSRTLDSELAGQPGSLQGQLSALAAAGGEGSVSTVSNAALNEALRSVGVNATRTDLQIDPPTAAGGARTTGYAMDPVNTATGNFIEPETDLAFVGAPGLALTRMYNSLPSGLAGPGWASVLDQRLELSDDGARWVLADGRAVDFPREGEGWGRAEGENLWLTAEADAADGAHAASGDLLVVRDNDGGWWAHARSGAWVAAGRGEGQTVVLHRAGDGSVSALEHERGLVEAVVSAAGVVEARNEYDELGRVRA